MTGKKINWRIHRISVGPEREIEVNPLLKAANFEGEALFRGPKEQVLEQYNRLREEGSGAGALVVTNEKGLPVYAVS